MGNTLSTHQSQTTWEEFITPWLIPGNNLIPKNLIAYVEIGYARHDISHRPDHVWKVLYNALRIIYLRNMQLTPEQWKVLPYLILCHDLLDHKQPAENKLPAEEVTKFYESELGSDLAAVIDYIHSNCSWSKRNKSNPVTIAGYEHYEQLRLLLQDADWLEAIGAGGIKRCKQCQMAWFPTESLEQIYRRVLAHMEEKLFLVYDALNFNESRALANERDLLSEMYNFKEACELLLTV